MTTSVVAHIITAMKKTVFCYLINTPEIQAHDMTTLDLIFLHSLKVI